MSKTLFAAAAAALTLASFTGHASAEMAQPRIVSTADVNFNDPVSVDRLYSRLTRAADAACRAQAVDARLGAPDRGCVADAVSRAVAQANHPMLTARYEKAGRNGQALAQGYR